MKATLNVGDTRTITAHTAPEGKEFDCWEGDTDYVDDINANPATVTMPSANVLLTAIYKLIETGGYGALYNWFCTQKKLSNIKYGYLYNWYAATDSRNIAPIGFHVPTWEEITTLMTYLGGSSVAGGHLKEIGFSYWASPNTGADNSSGFNGRGSGWRWVGTGEFSNINWQSFFWTDFMYDIPSESVISPYLKRDDADFSDMTGAPARQGSAIRFIADSGTPTIAIGNDGKVYPYVQIGDQIWTAVNSMETKYQNGDLIPEVTDNTEWAGLSIGGRCSYNNDESNAGEWTTITSSDDWVLGGENWYQFYDAYNPDAGGKLKETGLIHWNSPNVATNEYGFNAVGSGYRDMYGEYTEIKNISQFWSGVFYGEGDYEVLSLQNTTPNMGGGGHYPVEGNALRLCNPSTLLAEGATGTYTGNDLKTYDTKVINGVEWLTSNLNETQWRDGTWISGYDGGVYTPISNEDWVSRGEAEEGLMCYYDDDETKA